MTAARRLVVGVSGATGIVYAICLLEILADLDTESRLVVAKAAERTVAYAPDRSVRQLRELADSTTPIRPNCSPTS